MVVLQAHRLGRKEGLAIDQQGPHDEVLALVVVLDRDEEVVVPPGQLAGSTAIRDAFRNDLQAGGIPAHCTVDGAEAVEEGGQLDR